MPDARWTFLVEAEHGGLRIDMYLALQLSPYSRVQLRRAVQEGAATVDGRTVKPSFRVQPGQRVEVVELDVPEEGPVPEPIALDVLFEDEHLVAINKPAGMVVHPARGHWSGTLTNALAHHFNQLSDAGGRHRPGIVHRLDRDTSGVILVAKSNRAHYALADLFQSREVTKEYLAVVAGEPDRDADRIVQPIGPHPYQREKMAIRRRHPKAREAETRFEVAERLGGFAVVRVLPRTGRTHQIRLHMAHIGCPVLCDRLYGGRSRLLRSDLFDGGDATELLTRQALHAHRIALQHPLTRQPLDITAPLADDLRKLIALLRRRRDGHDT